MLFANCGINITLFDTQSNKITHHCAGVIFMQLSAEPVLVLFNRITQIQFWKIACFFMRNLFSI